MSAPAAFDALVVGGGVHGLATVEQLLARGVRRVGLAERFRFGHPRGSSHGTSRITRSSYGVETYVRLMQRAHAEDWPRLERDAGEPLLHRCDGAYFGPAEGPFEAYAAAVAAVGVAVERLEVREARRRFPAFAFPDAAGVLHDRTGGVIAASRVLECLARRCWAEGAHLLEDTRVLAIDYSTSPIVVETHRGTLTAERVVVTAGPWLARLLPEFGVRVQPKRQHVGYFTLAGEPGSMRPGRFPVWAYVGGGPGARGLFYGLPEFGRPGVKAADHLVAGEADDPDAESAPDEDALAAVRRFLDAQLAVDVVARVGEETCFYTNTPDEDFILDTHPDHERLVVGSACSGHGFKFAPLVGRILADLALDGRSSVDAFEADRHRFAIRRDPDPQRPS